MGNTITRTATTLSVAAGNILISAGGGGYDSGASNSGIQSGTISSRKRSHQHTQTEEQEETDWTDEDPIQSNEESSNSGSGHSRVSSDEDEIKESPKKKLKRETQPASDLSDSSENESESDESMDGSENGSEMDSSEIDSMIDSGASESDDSSDMEMDSFPPSPRTQPSVKPTKQKQSTKKSDVIMAKRESSSSSQSSSAEKSTKIIIPSNHIGLKIIPNFLTHKQCRELIQIAEDIGFGEGYEGYGDFRTADFSKNESAIKLVLKALGLSTRSKESIEDMNVYKYEERQHSEPLVQEGLEIVQIFLNAITEGGATKFPHIPDQNSEPFKIQPKEGMAVIWTTPSESSKYYQEATIKDLPVKSGVKYILEVEGEGLNSPSVSAAKD